jgi:glycerophosphoryl diester phosphodiesterase
MTTHKFRKRRRWLLGALALFLAFLYLNNTSRLAKPLDTEPWLVAHRGVHQLFEREGLTNQTCTAERMLPLEHGFLENTLDSMRAAFAYGARAVEVDVQRTADDRFVVFHDWRVDCRTEGEGRTRDHTLRELQALDIGHGYTADRGKSFPFRGRGVRRMPSLDEVLDSFPGRELVLDLKSNEQEDGALLAERLAALSEDQRSRVLAYGRPAAIEPLRERFPDMLTITRPRLKRCLKGYLALGWTGHVPEACRNGLITVPANVAPWLWGWPNRFLRRMDGVGSRVVLIGDYQGGSLSQGFDDPERFQSLPADYSGGVWTDRIDLLGPLLEQPRAGVNTKGNELCSFLTADGRFLLSTSNQELYWVDAVVLGH